MLIASRNLDVICSLLFMFNCAYKSNLCFEEQCYTPSSFNNHTSLHFTLQELKNNKIEEDLDRGLTGGVHTFGGLSSHSSLTSGYQSSLGGHSGPSSLGSLQPSLQPPLR